jgi:hypothetical protein
MLCVARPYGPEQYLSNTFATTNAADLKSAGDELFLEDQTAKIVSFLSYLVDPLPLKTFVFSAFNKELINMFQ